MKEIFNGILEITPENLSRLIRMYLIGQRVVTQEEEGKIIVERSSPDIYLEKDLEGDNLVSLIYADDIPVCWVTAIPLTASRTQVDVATNPFYPEHFPVFKNLVDYFLAIANPYCLVEGDLKNSSPLAKEQTETVVKRKPGRKSEFSDEEQIETVIKWIKCRNDPNDNREIKIFLIDEFGEKNDDSFELNPIVSRSTLYNWWEKHRAEIDRRLSNNSN